VLASTEPTRTNASRTNASRTNAKRTNAKRADAKRADSTRTDLRARRGSPIRPFRNAKLTQISLNSNRMRS
jgi:hypothetical protein